MIFRLKRIFGRGALSFGFVSSRVEQGLSTAMTIGRSSWFHEGQIGSFTMAIPESCSWSWSYCESPYSEDVLIGTLWIDESNEN